MNVFPEDLYRKLHKMQLSARLLTMDAEELANLSKEWADSGELCNTMSQIVEQLGTIAQTVDNANRIFQEQVEGLIAAAHHHTTSQHTHVDEEDDTEEDEEPTGPPPDTTDMH